MHDERQPTFRADVQGLRALAVLTVIAAHAGVQVLPGGYVGVDVFFVISGFLISQMLFREVEVNGRVSIRDFYARRARRILPAATVVTLATLMGSLIWLSVVDALEVVTDALWATFFLANLRFADVHTDYFSQEQGPSPLQHYWSLAVEEQFYLVWPLILLGCIWVARRGRRTRPTGRSLPRLAVFWTLIGLGLTSFLYGVVLTSTNPVAAYFSTPARAWELAIGAVTALVARRVASRLDAEQQGALAATGLLAIAFGCLLYGGGTGLPGLAAVIPVIGTALVLLAGAGGQPSPALPLRMLSVRPMQRIGDWSYSLYLWHWPLLVIPQIRLGRDLETPWTLVMVSLTFLLAWLTYRFVEMPFRKPVRWPRRRALALYPATVGLVAASCLAASTYGHWKVGEFGDRPAITLSNSGAADTMEPVEEEPTTTALVRASVVAARNGMAIPSDLTPDLLSLRDNIPDVGECDYNEDVRILCERGDTDADRTIVVLGNSHAAMWIPAFERIAEQEGYRAYHLVKSNCTPSLVVVGDQDAGLEPWEACTEFRDWALDRIAELSPDLVVVSSSRPNAVVYDDDGTSFHKDQPEYDDLVRAGFEGLFARLGQSADRTVLIRDVPRSEDEPGPCLTTGSPDLGDCLFTPDPALEADSDLPVEVARQAGVEWIDPTKWVCWQNRCPAVVGDLLPYRDRGHLSAAYAETLADELGAELGIWSG